MKCNEAFDMIFNGGEAVLPSREYSKDYRLHFNEDGVLCVPRVEHTKSAPVLHKADLKRDDWIVEKDGVIYEEYVNEEERKEQGICAICLKTHKRFACAQNKLEELKEIGKRLTAGHGIEFVPSPQVSIDEDCLEAKMLCFVRRYNNEYGAFDKVTCGKSGCQFCFPDVSKEDKTQGTTIPTDKVTACEHIIAEIDYLRECAYQRGAYQRDACNMYYIPDVENEKLSELREKLEYLVSLQETKCLLNK